jgi:DNA-binding beta-propeller fold protein YncE
MSFRRAFGALVAGLILATSAAIVVTQRTVATNARPGALGGGVTLLPNGWRIAPVGRHFATGDLPLAMALSPDGHSLVVTNNGYLRPTLRVFDLDRQTASTVSLDDAWLGLAWHPDGTRLFSSGAASNTVQEVAWTNGRLRAGAKYNVAKTAAPVRANSTRPAAAAQTFVGGIAVHPDGTRLYAVHVFGQFVSALDLRTHEVIATADLPAEPYTCLLSADGETLFVSLWGGARVLIFDAKTLAAKGDVVVGEHPNAMALSVDGDRLFVACANTNTVWAIDTKARKATEQISTSLFPKAPPGSTPNALSVSPDGKRLAVANADNNTVAMVDISKEDNSRVVGFVPAGWYPTGVLFSRDGKQLFVLSGKGLTSAANPRGPQGGVPYADGQYSGSMLEGSVSILDVPDEPTLQKYTKVVYDLTPYTDDTRLAPAAVSGPSPIPRRVGEASPIKHVFYIIRENRSYDQVLGDLDRGNGDPTLTLFGENVTPNAHAIAREFITLDNFYVNAEVSYSGHAYSMGAIANDFVEKIWPINYGGRGGVYLGEGTGKMRTAYGNIAATGNGYLWDECIRKKVSVRSYGEFVSRDPTRPPTLEPGAEPEPAGVGPVKASVPGLEGRIHPTYPPFDLKVRDQVRADIWLREFQAFEKNGQLPSLSIIKIGNDHTNGTAANSPTPRAMVADNDLALGRIVEAVTHSVYWKDSAIFVLEDDAQNGPDHVDAHRSPGYVISPYVRRGVVDSTLYTTTGMMRTMELILGLEPLTQYDAAATPMYAAFQMTPVLTPFAKRDARTNLDEMNRASAPGAAASARMDFDEEDLIPENELNEILWKSVKGPLAVMPPPVHAAFVRVKDVKDVKDVKEVKEMKAPAGKK